MALSFSAPCRMDHICWRRVHRHHHHRQRRRSTKMEPRITHFWFATKEMLSCREIGHPGVNGCEIHCAVGQQEKSADNLHPQRDRRRLDVASLHLSRCNHLFKCQQGYCTRVWCRHRSGDAWPVLVPAGFRHRTFDVCASSCGAFCCSDSSALHDIWLTIESLQSPLSEDYGRRTVFIVSFGVYVLFTMATALASNIETMLICR